MTVEVEKKIIVPCEVLRWLGDRLESLGYRLVWKGFEEDVYYGHPCRDFASTDEALRIRFSEGVVEVTYKGPKKRRDLKVREEISIRVPDAGSIRRLLDRLGFNEVASVRKERIVYRRESDGSGVFLDRVECLGCFVEVEVLVSEGGYEVGVEVVERIVDELGLSSFRSTVKSYLELLLDRGGC